MAFPAFRNPEYSNHFPEIWPFIYNTTFVTVYLACFFFPARAPIFIAGFHGKDQ